MTESKIQNPKSKIGLYLQAVRPQFFTAAIVPVLVGTAIAYYRQGYIDILLLALTATAMTALQAGANVINDYFDHKSRNDWLNRNANMFSGGSRMIQKGLVTPRNMFILGAGCLIIGTVTGLVIVVITKSIFVLILGVLGVLGAYFYTATPIKLGYRTIGEIVIGFLFGILPVWGAYNVQTGLIDFFPLLPGIIVGILIFLIIFANEFPDMQADAAVSKKTLIVVLGVEKAACLYKIVLGLLIICLACNVFLTRNIITSAVPLIAGILLGERCRGHLLPDNLKKPGNVELNKAAVQLHLLVGVLLAVSYALADGVGKN